jgi:predicted  nucleic acid-binding Zn-ribbon protein
VPAEDLEKTIWHKAVAGLSFYEEDRRKMAEHLMDPQRWDTKTDEHKAALKAYRAQIAKAERAKSRLFKMLEADDFTAEQQGTFKTKLEGYDKQIADLEAKAEEVLGLFNEAQEDKQNKEAWFKLINEEPELLRQLADEVQTLGPEQRRRVIEAMMTEPITVWAEKTGHGKPAKWYSEGEPDTTKLAIFEQLAAENLLPVLTGCQRVYR